MLTTFVPVILVLFLIRNAVATQMFDRATTRQRFTISAGPYFCMLIVPSLIALARESAPGITLQIVNISANLAQALDQLQVDIALGAFDRVPPRLRSEVAISKEPSKYFVAIGNKKGA